MLLTAFLSDECQLWFPGLADDLVSDFNSRERARRDLADRYGTQRWLTGSAQTPVVSIGTVRIDRHLATIERLPAATAATFADLIFADGDLQSAREQVQAATKALTRVDCLADTIGRLVRSIHILTAPTDHDVSHSSPQLPFSVFVSAPDPTERDASIRLAESLIHEAMHLQLTLIDAAEPLVTDAEATGFSPWKAQVRPVAGLLHGLYVFAVIHEVLEVLADSEAVWRPYSTKRLHTIRDEVATLPDLADGLSMTGSRLWQRCRESILEPRRHEKHPRERSMPAHPTGSAP